MPDYAPIHPIEQPIRHFSGAQAVRVIDHPGLAVTEHCHDWPILSLYLLGAQDKYLDGDAFRVDGPAAIFHAAGRSHASTAGPAGFEQLDIVFDPAWLAFPLRGAIKGSQCWTGGAVGSAARKLADGWMRSRTSEESLRQATRGFLKLALTAPPPRHLPWLPALSASLRSDEASSTVAIARRLQRTPAWLAQAYRAAAGEGIAETRQRLRVERAVSLLDRGMACAEAAVAAGFCDQSHMIRTFRRLLGRTPLALRETAAAAARPQRSRALSTIRSNSGRPAGK